MKWSTKTLTKTAMMVALVFICTYTFKIPVSITNGYTHLGDGMIFLAVILLGKRNGAIAGAMGAALADFIGGFLIWVVPTLIIKACMAYVMGFVIERFAKKKRCLWMIGAILGGILQVVGYTFVKVFMIGWKAALLTIPGITLQTLFGMGAAFALIQVFEKTGTTETLKSM